jgi:hypothetical protein
MAVSTTDLAVTPDQYSPVLNSNGEYSDALPYGRTNSHWYCPCSNGHAFKRSALTVHFRSKKHQRWLSNMNANRKNHLTQFIEAQRTIKSQTRIIAEQQKSVCRAQNRVAGLEHIIRKRDERVQELEAQLYLLSCSASSETSEQAS